ncbi:hypothetical protein ACED16_02480 [Enterobacter hormaechei]
MMKQEKLDFDKDKGEKVTPAKGSIYPFSKHSDDWAFVVFLERVADSYDREELAIDESIDE